MAAASSSWQGALAPAQGNLQSQEGLTIATYNVGARDPTYMRNPKNERIFLAKLQADIAILVNQDTDVLCIQELNYYWRNEVDHILPGWQRRSSEEMTVSTYVKPGLHILLCREVPIFPESTGRKAARKVMRTVIGRSCTSAEQQQTWNVWNNHTIVGSKTGSDKTFKIDGNLETFCKTACKKVVKLGVDSMQGSKQCLVLLGDWNWFTRAAFGDWLRTIPGLPDYRWCGGDRRDFIVCFGGTQELVEGQQVIASDNSHTAIVTKIGALAPAQGNHPKFWRLVPDPDHVAALQVLAQAEEHQRAEAEKRAHLELEEDLREAAEEREKERKRQRLADEEEELFQAKAKADEEARLHAELAQELEAQALEQWQQRCAAAAQEQEALLLQRRAKEEEQAQARQQEQAALQRAELLKDMLLNMIRKRNHEEARLRIKEEEEEAQQDELLLQRRANDDEQAQEEEEQTSTLALMPCKGLVMPIGQHVWEARTDVVVEALRQVLALRREKLEHLPYTADLRILPFAAQKEVHDNCIYVFPTPPSQQPHTWL